MVGFKNIEKPKILYEIIKTNKPYISLLWVNKRYLGYLDNELQTTRSLIIIWNN